MTPQPLIAGKPSIPTTPHSGQGLRAESGRRLRQYDLRRRVLTTTIIAVLALLVLLSIPGLRALQTVVGLQMGEVCDVAWQLDGTNWWYGGTTTIMARIDAPAGSGTRYWSSRIGNPDLLLLQHLPRVHFLGLAEAENITDDGLTALSDLSYLTGLDLSRRNRLRADVSSPGARPLSDAALVHLEPLQKLETLVLAGNAITDAGLARLAKLPALQSLDLSATQITDAGLNTLRTMKSLKALNLSATRVSIAGTKGLQDARLDLSITIDGDCGLDNLDNHTRGFNR